MYSISEFFKVDIAKSINSISEGGYFRVFACFVHVVCLAVPATQVLTFFLVFIQGPLATHTALTMQDVTQHSQLPS